LPSPLPLSMLSQWPPLLAAPRPSSRPSPSLQVVQLPPPQVVRLLPPPVVRLLPLPWPPPLAALRSWLRSLPMPQVVQLPPPPAVRAQPSAWWQPPLQPPSLAARSP
jgi:hypothetical protein